MNYEWIWVPGNLVWFFGQTQMKEAGPIFELQADQLEPKRMLFLCAAVYMHHIQQASLHMKSLAWSLLADLSWLLRRLVRWEQIYAKLPDFKHLKSKKNR